MRVLQLMSGDIHSGAGKGVYRLHQGLVNIGVDSVLLQTSSYAKNDNNLLANKYVFAAKSRLNKYYNRYRLKVNSDELIFSLGQEPLNCFSGIDFSSFDIIHLHWVNGAISIEQIAALQHKTGKKVVFTYRDMWAFTGGCHYSLACNGFKQNDCQDCHLFEDQQVKKAVGTAFQQKKSGFSQLNMIAISDWMKNQAMASGVLSEGQITRIYNSVDLSVFYPRNADVKDKFKLKPGQPIVVAGAQFLSHAYKGGEIITRLFKQYKHEINFVFFGKGIDSIVGDERDLCIDMGFVDEQTLAELYSMADLFLMLSIQEAFGKTVIESLACATPVLTVKDTGANEITELLNCNLSIDKDEQNIDLPALMSAGKQFDFDRIQAELKQYFSLESIAEEHEKYYQSI